MFCSIFDMLKCYSIGLQNARYVYSIKKLKSDHKINRI